MACNAAESVDDRTVVSLAAQADSLPPIQTEEFEAVADDLINVLSGARSLKDSAASRRYWASCRASTRSHTGSAGLQYVLHD